MIGYKINDLINGGNCTKHDHSKDDAKVYFLIKDKKIVYVGQSINLDRRASQHGDKDFDNISFIYCKTEDLDNVEAYYIVKCKPKYNYILPPTDFYITERGLASQVAKAIARELSKVPCLFECKSPALPGKEESVKRYFPKKPIDKIIAYIKEEVQKEEHKVSIDKILEEKYEI